MNSNILPDLNLNSIGNQVGTPLEHQHASSSDTDSTISPLQEMGLTQASTRSSFLNCKLFAPPTATGASGWHWTQAAAAPSTSPSSPTWGMVEGCSSPIRSYGPTPLQGLTSNATRGLSGVCRDWDSTRSSGGRWSRWAILVSRQELMERLEDAALLSIS